LGELGYALSSEEPLRAGLGTGRTEDIAEVVVCGPDPQKHRRGIDGFVEAGFDHVYVHQVGRNQEKFFRFYSRELSYAAS
jgi:hypothetical protein